MPQKFLQLSPRITVLPVIHGSGDFAVEVRRVMLSQDFDCLAVPLPPSFQDDVERAVDFLPGITAVLQEEPRSFLTEPWSPERDFEEAEDDDRAFSYVPIDPCQPVIAALRIAIQEHMPRAFVDLETARFESVGAILPDPYALKKVPVERFAAGILPAIPRLPEGQPQDRVVTMAHRLRELERRYRSILFVCSITDWPWVKEAYSAPGDSPGAQDDDLVEATGVFSVAPNTSIFLLGELPFITGLYERARAELDDDENLSVDGIKELALAARKKYEDELKSRARKITPKLLATYFQYVRNLALVERRMTPDLYTLVTAARQIAGDGFAVHLAETAREYPYPASRPPYEGGPQGGGGQSSAVGDISYSPPSQGGEQSEEEFSFETLKMGIGRADLPDGEIVEMKNRLPGHPQSWRSCRLQRRPPKKQQREWRMRWDPFSQCSWPPEDSSIEKFRTHVKDAALALMGTDLARTEKFTTSLKDGLDIRETLRNWHTGDLYVKVYPPNRGDLDCVVMLFDSPVDPRDYPWRITWHAEHHDESTLALFATNFREEMVGPGIGLARYGGAMFLFPPRPIPNIWQDPRFDFADTLEERLLSAACHHSEERHVALLSPGPPGAGWRRLARRFGKRLVHVPLSRFSGQTVEQLRMFHVLNGHRVRSYAAEFIRKA